jgi:hypothetical protein
MNINHQPINKDEPPHIFPPENLNENIIFSKKVEIVGQKQIKEIWFLFLRTGANIDRYYQLHLTPHHDKVILIVNQEDDWTEFKNIDEVINQLESDKSGKEFNYRIFKQDFLYSNVRTPKSDLIAILKFFEIIANQASANLIGDGETSENFNKFIELAKSYLKRFGMASFNDNQDESNKLLSKSPSQDPLILIQAIANKPDGTDTSPQVMEVASDPFNLHNDSINQSSAINAEACEENLKTSADLDGSSDFISDNENDSDEETQDIFSVTLRKTFEYGHLCKINYSRNKSFNEYDIYNSKDSSNEITKISKLVSDASKESVIKENVQDAIRSSITQFNGKDDTLDSATKLKSYKYLLIAIYSQGVNKNEQYKKFLRLVNDGLSEQDKLTYSEAKKLSLIFQNICSGKNVFTGRIHSNENSKLVGMRSKRIPLELLLETARQDLAEEDFARLQKFNKKIKDKFEKRIPNQLTSRKGPEEEVKSPSLSPIASLRSYKALSQPPSPIALPLGSHASPPPRLDGLLNLENFLRDSSPKSFASRLCSESPSRLPSQSQSQSLSPSENSQSTPSQSQSQSQSLSPSENSQSTQSRSRSQSESPRKSLEAQLSSIGSPLQSFERSQSLSSMEYFEKENTDPNRVSTPGVSTPTIFLDTPDRVSQKSLRNFLPLGEKLEKKLNKRKLEYRL